MELFIRGFNINWDKINNYSYLRKIESIANINQFSFNKPVTFFVGENGSGKSTLLEAIAIEYGFNPEGGTRNYNFSTCDSHSELCEAIRLIKGYNKATWGYFLRAESFYNVATAEAEYFQNGSIGLHKQSHGESFLAMVQEQFKANSLYILDEPEAALSPQRQLTLLLEINRCVNDGSQFIIVTHSPILLGFPDAEILSFDNGAIHSCEYEDTDSYQVTNMFINNREQFIKRLFYEQQ